MVASITNPTAVANALDIQSFITFFLEKIRFFGFLSPLNIDLFFITLNDSIEVSDIISFCDVNKAIAPNSFTPTKFLKLLSHFWPMFLLRTKQVVGFYQKNVWQKKHL